MIIMKFNNIFLAFIALSIISLTSCKDENSSDTATDQTEASTIENQDSEDVALNPAHGQPGHSCAIPVGAPLNQESSVNTTQQAPAPTNSGVSPVRLNSSTATPQKNPPHGQPGHDCAKPVGADLN